MRTVTVWDHASGDDAPQCVETFADLQTACEAAAMFMEDACAEDHDHEGRCRFSTAAASLLAGYRMDATVDGFQVTISGQHA